ncbi:hem-containing dehydratase-domain containing protein [Cladorrhinum sp. PSN259]|nr:hem-containing dehydratase-domain containing protein [Cladorrhinum sp. PSN259]
MWSGSFLLKIAPDQRLFCAQAPHDWMHSPRMSLDSAIPKHLRCPRRTQQASTPAQDFEPPYPSYSARFPENVSNMVMAVIGAQYKTAADADGTAQTKLSTFFTSPNCPGPSFFEWASVTDAKGYYNLTALSYWPSKGAYETWTTESGFDAWWRGLTKPEEECSDKQHGWFLEVFFPTVERLETLFNTNATPEGFGHLKEGMSEAVQEHGYWGSMRDRLPAAQVDALVGDKAATVGEETNPREGSYRVKIEGKKNLTVIRSGQDWLDTSPEERKLYLEEMHPVLTKGMDFLRDNGREVGCHSCRLMDVVDPVTLKADKDRTFGLAYFDDIASLEKWSKEHPTHLAIFGGFHQYARKLGNNVTLRVFHEVMVLEAGQQVFEYVGCHEGTGMLKFHRV